MTDPAETILVDVAAAQDALARSDEGESAWPGDELLIAAYEGFCQQEQARYEAAGQDEAAAAWLATQCPVCEPGGSGELCDDHCDEES